MHSLENWELFWEDQAEYTGRTALAIAAQRGNAEAVRFLLGARADANIVDLDGATPGDLAREGGHTHLLHELSLTQGQPRAAKGADN